MLLVLTDVGSKWTVVCHSSLILVHTQARVMFSHNALHQVDAFGQTRVCFNQAGVKVIRFGSVIIDLCASVAVVTTAQTWAYSSRVLRECFSISLTLSVPSSLSYQHCTIVNKTVYKLYALSGMWDTVPKVI